jgi:hypothetical protein
MRRPPSIQVLQMTCDGLEEAAMAEMPTKMKDLS